MSFLTLSKLTAAAAAAGAEPGNLTVVFTGLSLVFLILLILIVVILIQGKIFTSLAGRKGEKAPAATPAPQPPAAAQAAPAVPVVQAGISPEVVAAIMAAISAATGGAGVPLAIAAATGGQSGAPAKTRRGAWGLAGALQTTEPF